MGWQDFSVRDGHTGCQNWPRFFSQKLGDGVSLLIVATSNGRKMIATRIDLIRCL
jgi:hypothetical protein